MRHASSRPLSDREVGELDGILAAIPDERDPLDVVMLDGFLIGVLLQPEVVLPSGWLPLVFDAEGGDIALPGDAAQATRAIELIMRRYNELAACIVAREFFDPIVFELDDEHGEPLAGKDGIAALAPWAAGFTYALSAFPSLEALAATDEKLAATMIGILRHLPIDPDAAADIREEFTRDQRRSPAKCRSPTSTTRSTTSSACVLEIAEITRPNRPATRETPKVGRNDPCPCGSGRKYKVCHGRGQ